MNLKEKLDLLWKYLLLAVLVYGFHTLSRPALPPFCGHPMMGAAHDFTWFGDDDDEDMDIRIEKLAEGDSSVVIMINGEIMDLKGLRLQDLDDDAKVFIKKMKGHGDGKKMIKIIHKEKEEMEEEDDD